jgi:AAA domain
LLSDDEPEKGKKQPGISKDGDMTSEGDETERRASGSNSPETLLKGTKNPKKDRNGGMRPSSAPETEDYNKNSHPPIEMPGGNVREKLEACLAALGNEESGKVVASGNLKRSHDEIRKFLRHVIKSKGRKGGKSKVNAPILYICGAPGTGKTSSTMQLCHEAIDENKSSLESWENPPRVSFQNCSVLQSLSKADALEKIKKDLKMTTFNRCEDESTSFAAIVVLDEVDNLVGSSRSEDILETLSCLAKDEKTVLSLIGISNSVHNKKTHRMFEFGMVSLHQSYRQLAHFQFLTNEYIYVASFEGRGEACFPGIQEGGAGQHHGDQARLWSCRQEIHGIYCCKSGCFKW